jgi:pilus assembly protein CpaE
MSAEAPPTVLLFTVDPRLDELTHVLEAHGLDARRVATVDEARRLLAAGRARTVAVLDTTQPAPFSFAELYRLLHEPPSIPTLVLLLTRASQAEWTQKQDDTSLDDYELWPAALEEVRLRVQALLVRAGFPAQGPAPSVSAPVELPHVHPSQVVVVFGPKGGVGSSMIAANLAVGLALLYRKQVVAVDADLWFGDLGLLLNLKSDRDITALVKRADQLDLDALREVLHLHPTGLQVLLGPAELTQVETIPVGFAARVVGAYRSLFDFVVVDAEPTLDEDVLQLLQVADCIVLVTTPEISSIRCAGQVIQLAPKLGWTDKRVLVLNDLTNYGVQLEDVQKALGLVVDATIASDGQSVVHAANYGQPMLLSDPAAEKRLTRDLRHLLTLVAGAPIPTESQGSTNQGKPRRSPGRR